jgi:hypothetical protein
VGFVGDGCCTPLLYSEINQVTGSADASVVIVADKSTALHADRL